MRPGADAPDDGAVGGPVDPLVAAAALRWSRPDLTAALADHVLETAALADDRDLWLRAAGWAVHARSATGDGRETAADVIDCLPDWGPESLALVSAHRLRVELALVSVNVGRTDTASLLVEPVAADGVPAELRADALGVLARCAVEDDAARVESVLRQADQAWVAAGSEHSEVGRASTALIGAAAHRRAGRPAQAVDRATAGLARLERRTGSAGTGTRSGYLAAALAAEWLLALLDAGQVDEAHRGCAELAPRLAESRPSRQLARLRLVVARTNAAESPPADTAQELGRAVRDAAECGAPDLEAVCCSALGTVYETAGRPDIALTTVERGVAAQRIDRGRDKRFRDALAILPMEVLAIDHGFTDHAGEPGRSVPPARPASDLTRPALRAVEAANRPDDRPGTRAADAPPAGPGRPARREPDQSRGAGNGEVDQGSPTTVLPATGGPGRATGRGRQERTEPDPPRRSRHGLAVDRAWQVGDFAPPTRPGSAGRSGPAGNGTADRAVNGARGRSTPASQDSAPPDDDSAVWDVQWADGGDSPIGDLLMRSMRAPEQPAGRADDGPSASPADALTRPATRRTDVPDRRVNGSGPTGRRRLADGPDPAGVGTDRAEGSRAERQEPAQADQPRTGGRGTTTDRTTTGMDRNGAGRTGPGRATAGDIGADEIGSGRTGAPRTSTGADRFSAGRTGAGRAGADRVGADRVGADRVGADRVGADRTRADRTRADRDEVDRVGVDQAGADPLGVSRASVDRAGGGDDGSPRPGERRTAAEELEVRRAAAGRSEPGLVVADWLASELADLERIWERISEPPGASVMPPPEPAAAESCVVSIDIARDGRRQVGRRSAKLVRALADALAGHLPAGGRTEQDEPCVLSVVLPDLDQSAAEDWMRRTLIEVLDAGSADLDAAGLQLRAAVRDGERPAGPQFVRDFGGSDEPAAVEDGDRSSGGGRRRRDDGLSRPALPSGGRSADRGRSDPGPVGLTRPGGRPLDPGQPTEIVGDPTPDPLGGDGRAARRSRVGRAGADPGNTAGSAAAEPRRGRRRAGSDADHPASRTDRPDDRGSGAEPAPGGRRSAERSAGAGPSRARRDIDALDSYRADGDGPGRFPADRFGAQRSAPSSSDGPEPGRRRSRRSDPEAEKADRFDSYRSGGRRSAPDGTSAAGPDPTGSDEDPLGIDPPGLPRARPGGDPDEPMGSAPGPLESLPSQQGTGRRRADRVAPARRDRAGAGRDRGGREDASRDGAERDGAGRDRADRDDAGRNNAGRDRIGRNHASRDDFDRDGQGRDDASRNDTGQDPAGRNHAGRGDSDGDSAGRDDAGLNNAGRNRNSRNHAGRGDSDRHSPGRDDGGRDRGRNHADRDDADWAATTGLDDDGRNHVGWDSAGRDDASRDDASRDDASRDDASRDDASRNSTSRNDATQDDEGRDGAGRSAAGEDDGGRHDAGGNRARRDDSGQDPARRNGAGRDAPGGDSTRRNRTGRDSSDRDGAGGDVAGRNGASRNRAARDGAARDGAARDGAARDGAARDGAGRTGDSAGRSGAGGAGTGRGGGGRNSHERDAAGPDGSTRSGAGGDATDRARAGSERAGTDPGEPDRSTPPRHAGTDPPGSTGDGATGEDPASGADQGRGSRSGRARRRIDASTEGLGLADLLAGALAEYRGI